MTKTGHGVWCALALWTAGAMGASPPQAEATKAKIGIYDSRAVAMAWSLSPACRDTETRKGQELEAAAKQARAGTDAKRTAEAEAALEKYVRTVAIPRHKQVFSTAPVDDVIAHIKDRMPAIAKTAGVESIVCKWDKKALAKYESAARVDVTMEMVRAFSLSEEQVKAATGVLEKDPIPLEQAEKMDWSKE